MLTAHTIKIIQSLDKKKFRQKYNLFLVEGNKIIRELYNSNYKIKEIFSIEESNDTLRFINPEKMTQINERDLKKISFLQHPKDSVALCEIPENAVLQDCDFNLVLDGIQDPGNLGTLIRLADWFGVQQVVCSLDTADVYNPKVIQATMGSFTRVNVVYTDLVDFLSKSENQNIGTDMEGENLYEFNFPKRINLVLGNEGKGMRAETEQQLKHRITIPRFGEQKSTESLNVSMAAGIILGQIFSRKS
ncbi:MAG: RNA methyltransferase [Cruoricaptor ignavus]|nr:RNA methyltransferase [Cruoricaptor ignavus]